MELLVSYWLVSFIMDFSSSHSQCGDIVGKAPSGSSFLTGHFPKCLCYSVSVAGTLRAYLKKFPKQLFVAQIVPQKLLYGHFSCFDICRAYPVHIAKSGMFFR